MLGGSLSRRSALQEVRSPKGSLSRRLACWPQGSLSMRIACCEACSPQESLSTRITLHIDHLSTRIAHFTALYGHWPRRGLLQDSLGPGLSTALYSFRTPQPLPQLSSPLPLQLLGPCYSSPAPQLFTATAPTPALQLMLNPTALHSARLLQISVQGSLSAGRSPKGFQVPQLP